MSKMYKMLMEIFKCYIKGILVNKVVRKRLGEKFFELILEEILIKMRLD